MKLALRAFSPGEEERLAGRDAQQMFLAEQRLEMRVEEQRAENQRLTEQLAAAQRAAPSSRASEAEGSVVLTPPLELQEVTESALVM